jgi:hypothetical protein
MCKESRWVAILLRMLSVNLAILVVSLVNFLTQNNFPLAFALGTGFLTSGLVYSDKSTIGRFISDYTLGLLIGALAGYGVYHLLMMDWRWSLPLELNILTIFLLVSSVPQILQVFKHNSLVAFYSLFATGIVISIILYGLLLTSILSLDNSYAILFLIPSLIAVTQALLTKLISQSRNEKPSPE